MTDQLNPEGRALIELLPCPFCGGPAKKPIRYNGAWETGCAGDFNCAGTDVLIPLAGWNTRAEGRRSGEEKPTLAALHAGAKKYAEVAGRAPHFSAFMQGVYAVLSLPVEAKPAEGVSEQAIAEMIYKSVIHVFADPVEPNPSDYLPAARAILALVPARDEAAATVWKGLPQVMAASGDEAALPEPAGWICRYRSPFAVSGWKYSDGPAKPDLPDPFDGTRGHEVQSLYAHPATGTEELPADMGSEDADDALTEQQIRQLAAENMGRICRDDDDTFFLNGVAVGVTSGGGGSGVAECEDEGIAAIVCTALLDLYSGRMDQVASLIRLARKEQDASVRDAVLHAALDFATNDQEALDEGRKWQDPAPFASRVPLNEGEGR